MKTVPPGIGVAGDGEEKKRMASFAANILVLERALRISHCNRFSGNLQ